MRVGKVYLQNDVNKVCYRERSAGTVYLYESNVIDELIYHIRIKKEYASSLIEDLQQVDAIEIIGESIPDWQKQESLKRLADMKANPDSTIGEEQFFNLITIDEDRNFIR